MLAEINGAVLAYDDAGRGAAVVLLHAGIADRSMWDAQVDHFSSRYRVVRPDLRGYGDSSLSNAPFAHVADVLGLLDLLRVEEATLVGVSMGGEVALDFALAHPARVARLVLVSTLAAMEVPSDALKANWDEAGAAFARGDLAGATEVEVRGWIVGNGRRPRDVSEPYRAKAAGMIRRIWDRAGATGDEVAEVAPDSPRLRRLAELAVPVLLIVGDRDFPDVSASIDRLHAGIAGSRKVVIPDASHLPPTEHPQTFNAILEGFLPGG